MNDESREPFKRLFFALDCAPAQRKAIAQWRGALQLRSGRPVPVENFHLTLKFLGAVAVGQIADICTAVASVRTPDARLTVALDRLDVWRRAGVLVLAPEQAPPARARTARVEDDPRPAPSDVQNWTSTRTAELFDPDATVGSFGSKLAVNVCVPEVSRPSVYVAKPR